jgi:MFS family permease
MQPRPLRGAEVASLASRWRTYSLFAFGVLTSSLGDRMAMVAIAAMAYQRTGRGLDVGLSLALLFAPFALFSMVGGYLADRYPRTLVIVVTHVGGAAAAAVLAFGPPLPLLLALVFALGASQAVSTPATRALIADLVPGEDELTRGNAIFNFFYNACFFAGPYLAGVVFALAGAGLVFLLDALTFLVSAGALTLVGTSASPKPAAPASGPSSLGSRLASALSGASILWAAPKTRGVALSIVAVVLSGATLSAALIGIAERVFRGGSVGFGILVAGTGLGLLLGGLYVVLRPARDVDHWLARGIALMAIGYAVVAGSPVLLVAAGGLVLAGVGNALQNLANAVVIQRTLPREEHGRAFGGLFTFSMVSQVVGLLAGGVLLDAVPARLIALGCAALMAVAVAVAWLAVSSPISPQGSRSPSPPSS